MAFQTLWWLSISSLHPAADVEGAEPALQVVNVWLPELRLATADEVIASITIPSHSGSIILRTHDWEILDGHGAVHG